MTVKDITTGITFYMRHYGFRMDEPRIRATNSEVIADFAEEPATGMAWFSQSKVRVSIRFWHSATLLEMNADGQLWATEPVPDKANKVGCSVQVDYEHHNAGSNGFSRNFVATAESRFGEETVTVELLNR